MSTTLESVAAAHELGTSNPVCACGYAYNNRGEWIVHFLEEIRAAFVLVARPTPILGDPQILRTRSGHIYLALFPWADDDHALVERQLGEAFESLQAVFPTLKLTP